MPSLGHSNRLPYRERETPLSVINDGAWLFPRNSESTPAPSPCNLSLYNPECLMSVHLGSRREPRCPRVVHPKVEKNVKQQTQRLKKLKEGINVSA